MHYAALQNRVLAMVMSTVTSICALSVLTLTVLPTHAQEPVNDTIQMQPGEVLEITAVSDRSLQLGWVLTQDLIFVASGREPVFQTRIAEPGSYTLNAIAQDENGNQERWKISVIVKGDPTGIGPITPEAGDAPIETTPSLQGGTVTLPIGSRILTIQPRTIPATMEIDADLDLDTNRDGDAENDIDNELTLSRYEGTPLRLWLLSFRENQRMRVTTDGGEGRTMTDIALRESSIAQDVQPGTIDATESSPGTFLFAFRPEGIAPESLLLHWNFGDGSQSLQVTPKHTYDNIGSYVVTVDARDIRSGDIIASAERTIEVTSLPIAASSESSAPVEAPPNEENPPIDSGLMRQILQLGGVAFAAIIGGILIVGFVVRLLRRSKRLDTPTGGASTPTAVIDAPPPPLELKKAEQASTAVEPEPDLTPPPEEEAPAPKEEPKPEEAFAASEAPAEPRPSIEPRIDVDKAPDWLKQGLAAKPETATAPAESEAPAEPTPAPEEPAPTAEASVEAPNDEDLLPPWLQEENTSEPSPPTPEPTPPPEVESKPEPEPEPEPPAPPAAPTPTPTQTKVDATSSPDALAREERELERKRRKRQRYRENLKKRQAATKVTEPPTTPTTPPPSPQAPVVAQSITSAPDPKPAPVPSPAPPPAPTPPTPPKELPIEPLGPADDDVAFLIKADSVEAPKPQEQPKPEDTQLPPPPEQKAA